MNERLALRALTVLRFGFTVAPIIAGVDKFVNLLADWERYLAPWITDLIPLEPRVFMMIVGAVEVVAGIVVAAVPRVGGWVVAGWLGLIIVNLILLGGYWDIALRDLGLLLGAVALALLAQGAKKPAAG